MKKKFGFKKGRAIRYSTQKPMQKPVDSVKSVERSAALSVVTVVFIHYDTQWSSVLCNMSLGRSYTITDR